MLCDNVVQSESKFQYHFENPSIERSIFRRFMLSPRQIMVSRTLGSTNSIVHTLGTRFCPWSPDKIETKLDTILNNYHTDAEISTKILHAAKTKANCPLTCETRCHVKNKLKGNLKIETQAQKPDCRGANGIHGEMGVQVRIFDLIA